MYVLGKVMGGPGAQNSEKNTASRVTTATRTHRDDVVVLVTNVAVWEIPTATGQDHGI